VFSLVFFWEKGALSAFLKDELIGLLAQTKRRNGNGNRGRLDITADILEASNGGVRKTYLMYRCNLSFKQLKYYLGFLLGNELLSVAARDVHLNHCLFETTDKGKEFLKAYKGLKTFMKEFG
jgi:predicted transcriptional regulator